MKIKYRIPTPYGVETRTSHREYTHIVVYGALKPEVSARRHAESLPYTRELLADYRETYARIQAGLAKAQPGYNYPQWIAEKEAEIARLEASKPEEHYTSAHLTSGPKQLAGYAGSEKLAASLARAKSREYLDVQIIPILPEYKS